MAEQKKQMTQEPVYGSLAYDLDALEREDFFGNAVRVPREEPLYRPEPERRQTQEPRPRHRTAARPRQQVSPLLLGGTALLAVMVVVLLAGYIRLNSASHVIAEKQAQLEQVQEDNVALGVAYEKAFDQAAVKAAAQAAGMARPSSDQIEYIELGGADLAEVCRPASDGLLARLWSGLCSGVDAVVEYFR